MSKVWLVGYLSGFDMAATLNNKPSFLSKLNSAEQAWAWMDNFCKSYPLKKVSEGGTVLWLELGTGKKPDGYLK